jgi:GNAT superfamily N-acetyltransferase
MKAATHRKAPGDELRWREAVSKVISSDERDGQLISGAEAVVAIDDDRCYLLISEIGDAPIGILTAYRFPDLEAGGAPLVYLYNVEVLQSYRGRGVGKSLLNQLIELCDADGVKLVWSGTEATNKSARLAFESTDAELEGDSYVEYEWDLLD